MKNFINKQICKYLIKNDNFKDIYFEMCKSYNPAYSKWYNKNSIKSATGFLLEGSEENIKEIYHKDILRFNKQSIAFYLEILPFFYEYILESKLQLRESYSFLDIGTRTGAGANLYGQIFSNESWGYLLKLVVDTIDINTDWNKYMKLNPFINNSSNRDLFDIPENEYDICFCSHTIEHLDDPVKFVEQTKKVAKKFSVFSCPYQEINPIPGHKTITKEIIEQCKPKYMKIYKSVNSWHKDLECVVFIV